MTFICTVCQGVTDDWFEYWAKPAGAVAEKWYPVCPTCDKDFEHAAQVVAAAADRAE